MNYILLSYINKLYLVGQNNTSIKVENNQIKGYYLINKKWFDFKLKEYSKIHNNNEYDYETMTPKLENIGFKNISYPKDFYFIEKEEYSFVIEELRDTFKSEPLPEYKIFFVYNNNALKGKQKNIYVGIIDNLFIYFYLVKKYEFEIEFIVNYNNEEIMFKEIKDNIIPNGFEAYLNIMGSNHETISNLIQTKLYDINFKEIGFYINKNNIKINNVQIREYSKCLEYIPKTFFYCGIIQCLVNIKPLKEIFLNKQFLIDNKFIENYPITKKLYQIFQYKWFWSNNNEVDNSLICDINDEGSYLFKNCKLLIEFLLLHMHNEQRKENKGNYIKLDSLRYNSKDQMNNDFYKNNETIIQKLFFFETQYYCSCDKCKTGDSQNYFINCVLELESETSKNEIKICDLLDNLSKKERCENCKSITLKSGTKFNSCPQFLIIVIKHNNELKVNFKLNDNIELKKYITEDNHDTYEYNLISFIKNPPIEEKKKNGIIYCKSPVNKEWYKYEGIECGKTNINDIIKNEKSIPYLLIYQNKCVDKQDYKNQCIFF